MEPEAPNRFYGAAILLIFLKPSFFFIPIFVTLVKIMVFR